MPTHFLDAVSSRHGGVTSTQLTTDLIAPGRSLSATRVELNLNFQTKKKLYHILRINFDLFCNLLRSIQADAGDCYLRFTARPLLFQDIAFPYRCKDYLI